MEKDKISPIVVNSALPYLSVPFKTIDYTIWLCQNSVMNVTLQINKIRMAGARLHMLETLHTVIDTENKIIRTIESESRLLLQQDDRTVRLVSMFAHLINTAKQAVLSYIQSKLTELAMETI